MDTYEAKITTLLKENQKLRDEVTTAKSELAVTRNGLAAALARIGAAEHSLHGLETLESRLDEMNDNYERLSNLLRGEYLFDSEKFRMAIQSEVKASFGYYWPSLKTDMKAQLWREIPPPMKEYLEKEIGKLGDEVVLVRSELLALQQKSTAGENFQNGDPAIAELRQAVGRVEEKLEEFEAAMSETGRVQGFERVRRSSTSSIPRLTPNNTGNST